MQNNTCQMFDGTVVVTDPSLLQHPEGSEGDHEGGEGGRPDQADLCLDRHPACHRVRPGPCSTGGVFQYAKS